MRSCKRPGLKCRFEFDVAVRPAHCLLRRRLSWRAGGTVTVPRRLIRSLALPMGSRRYLCMRSDRASWNCCQSPNLKEEACVRFVFGNAYRIYTRQQACFSQLTYPRLIAATCPSRPSTALAQSLVFRRLSQGISAAAGALPSLPANAMATPPLYSLGGFHSFQLCPSSLVITEYTMSRGIDRRMSAASLQRRR